MVDVRIDPLFSFSFGVWVDHFFLRDGRGHAAGVAIRVQSGVVEDTSDGTWEELLEQQGNAERMSPFSFSSLSYLLFGF